MPNKSIIDPDDLPSNELAHSTSFHSAKNQQIAIQIGNARHHSPEVLHRHLGLAANKQTLNFRLPNQPLTVGNLDDAEDRAYQLLVERNAKVRQLSPTLALKVIFYLSRVYTSKFLWALQDAIKLENPVSEIHIIGSIEAYTQKQSNGFFGVNAASNKGPNAYITDNYSALSQNNNEKLAKVACIRVTDRNGNDCYLNLGDKAIDIKTRDDKRRTLKPVGSFTNTPNSRFIHDANEIENHELPNWIGTVFVAADEALMYNFIEPSNRQGQSPDRHISANDLYRCGLVNREDVNEAFETIKHAFYGNEIAARDQAERAKEQALATKNARIAQGNHILEQREIARKKYAQEVYEPQLLLKRIKDIVPVGHQANFEQLKEFAKMLEPDTESTITRLEKLQDKRQDDVSLASIIHNSETYTLEDLVESLAKIHPQLIVFALSDQAVREQCDVEDGELFRISALIMQQDNKFLMMSFLLSDHPFSRIPESEAGDLKELMKQYRIFISHPEHEIVMNQDLMALVANVVNNQLNHGLYPDLNLVGYHLNPVNKENIYSRKCDDASFNEFLPIFTNPEFIKMANSADRIRYVLDVILGSDTKNKANATRVKLASVFLHSPTLLDMYYQKDGNFDQIKTAINKSKNFDDATKQDWLSELDNTFSNTYMDGLYHGLADLFDQEQVGVQAPRGLMPSPR